MFQNYLYEECEILGNKARLVNKGFSQDINYIETYNPLVTTLKTIWNLLSFATSSKMKLYQINGKSVFLRIL